MCVYVSQNLLFSDIGENAVLKVVDFGFAHLLSDESKMLTMPCYTLTYAAPEVLSTRHNGGYTEACDLWSIGVILVSLTGTRGRGRGERRKLSSCSSRRCGWICSSHFILYGYISD